MVKLSIIIPMYNVEQYIGKCLESCLNQDLPKDEYDIIVVDDGSPDNSSVIVEEYIQRNNNIRIIHRKNGGLSAARNTGLNAAKGQYVWFVDSDDWIESMCLNNLIGLAEEKDLDVLCFGFQLAYPDGQKILYDIRHEKRCKVYKGEDFICKVEMPPVVWAALYKKDFLINNNLSFLEGILHEDQEFTPRAYYLAGRIAYVNMEIYNYLQRFGSIMKSSQNRKRAFDLLAIADSLYSFILENVHKTSDAYEVMMGKVNFAFSQSLAYYDPIYFPLSTYRNKPYYPLYICKKNTLRTKLKYTLANISLKLYLVIHKSLIASFK